MSKFARLLVLLAIVLAIGRCGLVAQTRAADVWPQWRGPTRDGQVRGQVWPRHLSEKHLSTTWSVPLEPSYSGPIIAADRLFVTETKDKKLRSRSSLRSQNGQGGLGDAMGRLGARCPSSPPRTVPGFGQRQPTTASGCTSLA